MVGGLDISNLVNTKVAEFIEYSPTRPQIIYYL